MKTVTTLSTKVFSEKNKFVSLGCLSQKMIDFIISKQPEYKTLLKPNTNILFWEDRIKHIELHRNDFFSDREFEACFSEIPNIISNPDYISVHLKDKSISFIKDFSSHISVAIRISSRGGMAFRTMYPITDAQLSNYISKNRAWEWPETYPWQISLATYNKTINHINLIEWKQRTEQAAVTPLWS